MFYLKASVEVLVFHFTKKKNLILHQLQNKIESTILVFPLSFIRFIKKKMHKSIFQARLNLLVSLFYAIEN